MAVRMAIFRNRSDNSWGLCALRDLYNFPKAETMKIFEANTWNQAKRIFNDYMGHDQEPGIDPDIDLNNGTQIIKGAMYNGKDR